MDFFMPVILHTGVGCVSKYKAEFSRLGKSCLIVTGAGSAKRNGALDDVLQALSELGIGWEIFSGITQNPTVSSCQEAGRSGYAAGAEFVIGIGGGSALDAAKAAAVFASCPDISEDVFYSAKWPKSPLPIVLVGTTSGTGSEVTNVSVLTDSRKRKHSIHDNLLYSTVSFGDPSYTMSVPKSVTLSTGIDVLTHCAESFFSKKANDISRACSIQGISLLYPSLLCCADGGTLSLEQRSALYDASILGGLAICVTGTCFPHNVGYYLTENYGVPHGFACASLFPALMRHVSACDKGYTDYFFERLGITEDELLCLTSKCLEGFSVHLTPEEIDSALPRWDGNGSVKNTLGSVSLDDIKKYLLEIGGKYND